MGQRRRLHGKGGRTANHSCFSGVSATCSWNHCWSDGYDLTCFNFQTVLFHSANSSFGLLPSQFSWVSRPASSLGLVAQPVRQGWSPFPLMRKTSDLQPWEACPVSRLQICRIAPSQSLFDPAAPEGIPTGALRAQRGTKKKTLHPACLRRWQAAGTRSAKSSVDFAPV